MEVQEIKQVAERIEIVLLAEDNITIPRLIEKTRIENDIVLIAIGYLLHEDRIVIEGKCQTISYKHFYYF